MEALQELEPCYDEHLPDYELSTEETNRFGFQINDSLALLPEQHALQYNKKMSQEIIKTKVKNQEKQKDNSVKDDLELSKQKVKDSLSEVSKENIRNIVKAEVKANTAIKCVTNELQAIIDKKVSLEKYLQECEFQLGYLTEQYNIEHANREQLDREMQTIAMITGILFDQIRGYENELKESFTTLAELKTKANEIHQQDKIEEEAFQIEYANNDTQIRQLKIELDNKFLSLENREQVLNEKAELEENISRLQNRLAIQKDKNRVLTERRNEYVQKLADRDKKKFELKRELESVLADKAKAKEMLMQQEIENQQVVSSKKLELELLKQKSEIQLNYINDINMELESTRSKNENLARLNDEIKQESGQNYEKCQQLCKKMQENKELRKNELLKCNEEVKLLQERLGKANESLRVEVTDIENLEMEIIRKKQLLSDASIKMSSLNDVQDGLKREIENQNIIYQKYEEENNRLNDTLNELQVEAAQLNEQYRQIEEDYETLQSKCVAEIDELKQNLNDAENEKAALSKDDLEFQNVKLKDEERLKTFKEENAAKLEELKAELHALQEQHNSEEATVKDLSEKLQKKNELRDKLRTQHQKLQKELTQLEDKSADTTIKRPQPVLQKPGGILKNTTLKSPQKKVTFDKSVKSVSLSESSQESVFDALLKGLGSRPVDSTSNENDDFSLLFKRNSPPERDFGK